MVTIVWVVSRLRLKGPSWYLIFIYITSHIIGATYPRLTGTLTSEVGYTMATTRRVNHQVHKNRWWHWRKKTLSTQYSTSTCCRMFFWLIIALTCLGFSSWQSSGSSQVFRRVKGMCKLVWQRFYIYS